MVICRPYQWKDFGQERPVRQVGSAEFLPHPVPLGWVKLDVILMPGVEYVCHADAGFYQPVHELIMRRCGRDRIKYRTHH
jgi:hypothetical protein